MAQATEGKKTASGDGPARRLTHGLLAAIVLVQPGCMCGCSLPSATRTVRASGSTGSVTDGSETTSVWTPEGDCCPHCSPASEKSRPVPIAR